jgi:DNA modification methylase
VTEQRAENAHLASRRGGTAEVLRADARNLPLADSSVDLVVTSPPYFALRSYQDGGEHYSGQIGDEPTPREFVDALIEVTQECLRVLKPTGSLFVNLGDKYVADNRGSGGDAKRGERKHAPRGPAGYVTGGMRQKSLMGIPWRYALRCIDDLGLILRAEVLWSKPNGMPESVTDRVRRSHENWFHLTTQARYFSAVDELREPHAEVSIRRAQPHRADPGRAHREGNVYGATMPPQTLNLAQMNHPLGKLPGSVWSVPTEPLNIPVEIRHAGCCRGTDPDCKKGVNHFAAFPTEWPKRIINGWCPAGICVACGEGRRPVVASVGLDMSRPQARRAHELATTAGLTEDHYAALLAVGVSDTGRGAATQSGTGKNSPEVYALADAAREVLGGYAREYLLRRPTRFTYECACPEPIADTAPAVVLDPFGGTGTTALVAKALGRHGISVDRSADYCRLAEWRTNDPAQIAKVQGRPKPTPVHPDEQSIFDLIGGDVA